MERWPSAPFAAVPAEPGSAREAGRGCKKQAPDGRAGVDDAGSRPQGRGGRRRDRAGDLAPPSGPPSPNVAHAVRPDAPEPTHHVGRR